MDWDSAGRLMVSECSKKRDQHKIVLLFTCSTLCLNETHYLHPGNLDTVTEVAGTCRDQAAYM